MWVRDRHTLLYYCKPREALSSVVWCGDPRCKTFIDNSVSIRVPGAWTVATGLVVDMSGSEVK